MAADRMRSQTADATIWGDATAPAPLFVRAFCGLCNQLRMVVSYSAYGQRFGRPLILHWQTTDACPGRFDDLFSPVTGCLIIHSMSELESLSQGGRLVCQPAQPTDEIWRRDLYNKPEMWAVLRPHADIMAAVENRLAALGGAGCFIACHVRRTDHGGACGVRSSDQSFYDFIDSQSRGAHHGNMAVFVATDNRETQQCFVEQYGTRVRGLTSIEHTESKLRHTTLFDAVVDIFTCVHACAFKGSNGSTFSDVITMLRQCKGLASGGDQHDLCHLKTTDFPARPGDHRFWSMAHDDPLDPAVVEWLHLRSTASEDRLLRQATARAMAM